MLNYWYIISRWYIGYAYWNVYLYTLYEFINIYMNTLEQIWKSSSLKTRAGLKNWQRITRMWTTQMHLVVTTIHIHIIIREQFDASQQIWSSDCCHLIFAIVDDLRRCAFIYHLYTPNICKIQILITQC